MAGRKCRAVTIDSLNFSCLSASKSEPPVKPPRSPRIKGILNLFIFFGSMAAVYGLLKLLFG